MMKKHFLLLIAFFSLALGAVACNSKASSEDSEDSTVSEFCDLLKDYTKKIDAAASSYEISTLNDNFEKDLEGYKDDDTELSKSEKKDVLEAFADLYLAGAYKQYELMGQSVSDSEKAEARRLLLEELGSVSAGFSSISDYINVFESKVDSEPTGPSVYEPVTTAEAFANLVNDYAIKVGAANTESQIDALGDRFEEDCEQYKYDNTYLSASEKEEIIDALTGLITAMGCKYAEFEGNTVDVATQSRIESYSRSAIEQVTANGTTISEIITAVENMAD